MTAGNVRKKMRKVGGKEGREEEKSGESAVRERERERERLKITNWYFYITLTSYIYLFI